MNKTRKVFFAAAVILLLLGVFNCENNPGENNPGENNPDGGEILAPVFSSDVSKFLDYDWEKEDTGYKWQPSDAGIITISGGEGNGGGCGCGCGMGASMVVEPSYFFNGNVLVTYAPEMIDAHKIMIFSLSGDGNRLTRDNAPSNDDISFNFKRGKHIHRDDSSPNSPLKLSNKLLGTWQGGGNKYAFNSDGGLKINSDQYGYLVKKNELMIVGPLVNGKPVGVYKKYNFTKIDNEIYLSYVENGKVTSLYLKPLEL